ncbi:MAG: nucleoside-diphosphate kinase [Chlorobi bacterium]|nr:nucleoside-diphosphate kinase [Chlorobiota bacterium]
MERTLAIIKPDATKRNLIGAILKKIEEAGFTIIGTKMLRLSKEQAESFYVVHKERPFFNSLVEFMTSGPVVALALEKENAVADLRKLMGATNPEEAEEGTIRKEFAINIEQNSIHGSDSPENAQRELYFFFSEAELIAGTR